MVMSSKATSRLYDIPILGTEADIPELVKQLNIQQVTIAIPSLKPAEVGNNLGLLQPCKCQSQPDAPH